METLNKKINDQEREDLIIQKKTGDTPDRDQRLTKRAY